MIASVYQKPYRGVKLNRTHPLSRGLVGCWIMNEGGGLSVWDYSGNANIGTLEGTAPVWQGGLRGHTINFPGTDERLDCGNGAPLDDLGNGSFTISFWMKSKDTVPLNYGMLFTKYTDGSDRFSIHSNATVNRIRFNFLKGGAGVSGGLFSAATTPFDTEWNHIVLVINRTTDKALLYMNTIKDVTEIGINTAPADISNTANFAWGAFANGTLPYEGLIDECLVYNRALLVPEINWLYREPYAMFEKALDILPFRFAQILNIPAISTGRLNISAVSTGILDIDAISTGRLDIEVS